MISIQGLRVDYDTVTAVAGVDLEVHAGEIVGLVGPNGAGKTSLIKAAAGLIEPIGGRIVLAGADMLLDPEKGWLHMGYMPDFSPVYEGLKVWEYLEVFAVAYRIPMQERMGRIKCWVERLNLNSKWDECIQGLSRGMRQRLVLAKTLLHQPDVLLLDEPASGMDPLGRIDLREILKERAREGVAVLISSHILSEMDELCTSLAVMEKGVFLVSGTLADIRSTLRSESRLHIKLIPPVESAIELLEKWPGISGVQAKDTHTYTADFSGGEESAADLLAALHHAGARVSSFSREPEKMESLFLQIGGKEVS